VCHSVGQKWNAYTIFNGAHENIKKLGRSSLEQEDNTVMNLKEIGW